MPDKNVTILESISYWPYNMERLTHQRDKLVRNHSYRSLAKRTPSVVLTCGREARPEGAHVSAASRQHLHCQSLDLSSFSK